LKRAVAAKLQGNGTAIIRDRASGTWQAFREPEEGRAAEAEQAESRLGLGRFHLGTHGPWPAAAVFVSEFRTLPVYTEEAKVLESHPDIDSGSYTF
jgi:hypothetical protein